MIVRLLAVLLLTTSATLGAQEAPQLVPAPVSLTLGEGSFALGATTTLAAEAGRREVNVLAEILADQLAVGLGRRPGVERAEGAAARRDTILLTTAGADPELGDEGYELTVDSSSVVLRAPTPAGLSRACASLRQLLPPEALAPPAADAGPVRWELPALTVRDQPRYPWRGYLLDSARHFQPVSFIKRTLDLLALHKLNVLHWHLTEDQGWRLEIDAYPRLTSVGAWRGEGDTRHGGFYSKEQVREIVRYAADRQITIVPEIEMPGHCQAALAAYPELSCTGGPFVVSTRWGVHDDVYCAGKEETFEFLTTVLEEVLELFPSEFIHVGGDEVPKRRWQVCEACQARIEAEGLADEGELQSWFIRRIDAWLAERGRRLVGWDEILEGGLAEGATVQSWRGMEGAVEAARAGHDVIASPTSHCYLDYGYDAISTELIYSFEPTPAELSDEQAVHVLGAEGNLWTEYAPLPRVDRQTWPRLAALAEVTWSPASARSWFDFSGRLRHHYERLDALGVQYYLRPPVLSVDERVFEDSLELRFENPYGRGQVRFTYDGSEPTADSWAWDEDSNPVLWRDTELAAAVFLPDGRRSEVGRWSFRMQQPRPAVDVTDTLEGLDYSYHEGRWNRVPDLSAEPALTRGVCSVPDIALAEAPEGFALEFSGYLRAPADGVYTFQLTSDDGSLLRLGDELVVDHDGLHGATTATGQRILHQGLHPFRLTVFQAGGDQALELTWTPPGASGPQRIPPGAFRRTAR